ncbi:MAG: aspartate aminotransferase family protein [Desulfobacterales bacterium]|nr:MAG: aspartate aminotransferase family protein [Desulfobacterales bacterium]
MTKASAADRCVEKIRQTYCRRTARSKVLFDKATSYLPGGDTRTAVFFEPYPTFIVRGQDCRVYDADDNEYIDHLNNYTVQLLGHNHPDIRSASIEQLNMGMNFAAPHEGQIMLAEELCRRIPCFEQVRFCNSGTEATMFAIRAARAFTGRDKVLKMEGIYHGTHDMVEISVFPSLSEAGDERSPRPVPSSAGIPANVFQNMIVAPFNDIDATKALIEANRNDLAAVIIEPVMTAAGVIPATQEYLAYLREVTHRLGIVLIFDEVVTFRLAPGGAQQFYGITPDLTCIGKLIGGGFAVGAFGGRREIISQFSPVNGKLRHSGTFNGHPVTMAAGLAALRLLTPAVYHQINELGDYFRREINTKVFEELALNAHMSGVGSLSFVHYTREGLHNYRDARSAMENAGNLPTIVHLCHLNNGIWIAERGEYALSTPMTQAVIDQTVAGFRKSFTEVLPVIEEYHPQLILK